MGIFGKWFGSGDPSPSAVPSGGDAISVLIAMNKVLLNAIEEKDASGDTDQASLATLISSMQISASTVAMQQAIVMNNDVYLMIMKIQEMQAHALRRLSLTGDASTFVEKAADLIAQFNAADDPSKTEVSQAELLRNFQEDCKEIEVFVQNDTYYKKYTGLQQQICDLTKGLQLLAGKDGDMGSIWKKTYPSEWPSS